MFNLIKGLILIAFVIGVAILSVGFFQKEYLPIQNQYPNIKYILDKRNRDDLLKKVFFDPSPWQEMNTYTAYKGDYFTIIRNYNAQ